MNYTIGEVAKKFKLSPSTLRYYDKEGLLPFVERKDSGIRVFSDNDLQLLDIIECLKMTGMPIKDIKIFIDWCIHGDTTLQERYNMFMERKEIVEEQMAALQKTLSTINYKCWYYKTALSAGTEKIHQDIKPRSLH
ncbi:MerR family transcriptional regulator [Clostridium akagii]|uniref:MerR family transcriptional regulator n=1 Tax=Clostridium akagii TaxID=91623 RepID=UPI00047D4429|nr:MerR family transcriptional regulator [Clostridium akagii]